jgi:hypothetical protein
MNKDEKSAATVEELVTLIKDTRAKRIIVGGDLINVYSFIAADSRGEKERPHGCDQFLIKGDLQSTIEVLGLTPLACRNARPGFT